MSRRLDAGDQGAEVPVLPVPERRLVGAAEGGPMSAPLGRLINHAERRTLEGRCPEGSAVEEISQRRHRHATPRPVKLAVRAAGRLPHPGWGSGLWSAAMSVAVVAA